MIVSRRGLHVRPVECAEYAGAGQPRTRREVVTPTSRTVLREVGLRAGQPRTEDGGDLLIRRVGLPVGGPGMR